MVGMSEVAVELDEVEIDLILDVSGAGIMTLFEASPVLGACFLNLVGINELITG